MLIYREVLLSEKLLVGRVQLLRWKDEGVQSKKGEKEWVRDERLRHSETKEQNYYY